MTLGIRRDPAHSVGKVLSLPMARGTKSRRYIDDFFLRTRDRDDEEESRESREGKRERTLVGSRSRAYSIVADRLGRCRLDTFSRAILVILTLTAVIQKELEKSAANCDLIRVIL